MQGQEQLFSHDRNDWETPQLLYDSFDAEFLFNFDLAASNENSKSYAYYSEQDDALKQSWDVFSHDSPHKYQTRAFCNPPYSKWQKFVEKAWFETHILNNPVSVVMLLPARTDTKAFHVYLYNQPGVEIRFIKGRLKFEIGGKPVLNKKGQPQPAPFPSLVAIFK